jgi:hypothetical protein
MFALSEIASLRETQRDRRIIAFDGLSEQHQVKGT